MKHKHTPRLSMEAEPPTHNKTTDEINNKYGPREGLGVVVWLVSVLAVAIIGLLLWLAGMVR